MVGQGSLNAATCRSYFLMSKVACKVDCETLSTTSCGSDDSKTKISNGGTMCTTFK